MGTEEEGGILPDVLTGDRGTGGIHEAGRVPGQGKAGKRESSRCRKEKERDVVS